MILLDNKSVAEIEKYETAIADMHQMKEKIELEMKRVFLAIVNQNYVYEFNCSQKYFRFHHHEGDWSSHYNVITDRKIRKTYGCGRKIAWIGDEFHIENAGDMSIFVLLKKCALDFIRSESERIENINCVKRELLKELS